MQAILKPVTHPELGEIIIRDALFAVGRHEPPFSDYDAAVVAKMSRRHARIFEQDGAVYLADLGSLNGTSINGSNLDSQPVALQRGDRICFTDLCYEIELLGASSRQAPESGAQPPVQLVLVPERQKAVLEPIAVTRFPFLISKASDVFSRYREPLPEEVAYISRRHAHLFLKGPELYIEDLGSTNGTFVGGERLQEHARQLHDGDLVAFGGDNFVYRVQLVYPGQAPRTPAQDEASKLLTATARGAEDVTRTTFVTSANSFLDIYCMDDEGDDGPAGIRKEDDGDEDDTGQGAPAGRWQRILAQPLSMLRELRSDVSAERKTARRRYWLAALAVIAGAALWAYFDTAPQRDMRALLDSGDYRAAALSAGRYLQQHPGDEEVQELAVEALLKAVVPDWQRALEDRDFDAAAQILAQAMPLAGDDRDNRNLIETLQWVTRLERFVAGRGGADAPVVMFRDEAPIRELLQWWDDDANQPRRALAAVAQDVPAFTGLRAQVFSHVRSLDSQRSLSLAAIDRLLEQLQERLQADDPAAVHALLVEFAGKYPRIVGVDSLRADLDKYERIDADVRARHWIAARRRVAETAFATPVFRDRVIALTRQSLPPTDLVRRYAEADGYWRDGDSDAALAALQQLAGERWGEAAERRLARDRKVLADYRQLQDSRGQAGYDTRLLEFFHELDPQRDSWYVKAVSPDFDKYRNKAVAQVQADYEAAGRAWKQYRDGGGIRAVQRLEAGVSATYRRQAELLGDAYRYSSRARELQALVQGAGNTGQDDLYANIVNEVKLQRQSLAELAMVLEPSLKQAKLDLLPAIKADEP